DTKNSTKHRGDIDGVTGRAFDALTKNWRKRGADAQWHVVAVGKQADAHTHQRVQGPTGCAVVEHGPQRGHASGLVGETSALWWGEEVRCGPGNTKEHQVNADTGGKQHRGPGKEVVPGFGMVGPHFDASDPGQRYDEHENDHQSNGDDVVPTEVGANPVHRTKNRGVSLIRPYRSPDHKRHNDGGRCDEDRFIDRSVFWFALQGVRGSRALHSLSMFRLR